MLDQNFFNTLPSPFPQLHAKAPWKFVIFEADCTFSASTLVGSNYNADPVLVARIESWITPDQYIFIERKVGEDWSTPTLGEHPGDGKEIRSIKELRDTIPLELWKTDIHPALR